MSTLFAATLVHVTTVPESLAFMTGQVGYMKERGIEVHAISSPGPLLQAFAASQEVQTHPVPMSRRITPFEDLISIMRLMRVMTGLRPSIVHAHTPKGGLLGMLAAFLCKVPVRIYHIRGLPFETATGFRRRLLRVTERLSCALAHQVLCVSHSARDAVVEEHLCRPEKIRVLLGGSGNGVDAAARFNPERVGRQARLDTRSLLGMPANATVIGFVGRIVQDKGIVELVKAWELIKGEFPDARLLIVGPFEPFDPVPSDIKKRLEVDDRVHLAGHATNTAPYYAAMDMLILPTYREGFPNVLLEAGAMGLPVVSTRVTGPVDAVQEGVTGLLVPARDHNALAAAMRQYLQDADMAAIHGQAGRKRVLTDFQQETIWTALHDEYIRLLSDRKATAS